MINMHAGAAVVPVGESGPNRIKDSKDDTFLNIQK
jgi:hypothetical protein